MPATIEQIAELRADVRHIIVTLDRISGKQDELFDRFGDHLGEDTRHFADIHQEMAVAAAAAKAEKRGVSKAAHIAYTALMTALAFLAGIGGGHVKIPGMH